MRASKRAGFRRSTVTSQHQEEIHISGAEGIYEESDIAKIVKEYTFRSLNHSKGKPDKIVITIERLAQKPKRLPLLSVNTLNCNSPYEAKSIVFHELTGIGISNKAINEAFKILKSDKVMRGASLVLSESGIRKEPDKQRGVRVSRLGIDKSDKKRLSARLSALGINMTTVKEALMLASKIAACPDIVAEICISDDPDYTTGYMASKQFGYLRIPNIKNNSEVHGGRVFFLKEGANIENIVNYLEKQPVILYQET